MKSYRFFMVATTLWLGTSITAQAATLVSTDVFSSDEAFAACAINNVATQDVTLGANAIQLLSGASQTPLLLFVDQCNGQILAAGQLCVVQGNTAGSGVTCKANLPGTSTSVQQKFRARVELRNINNITLLHDDLR